MALILPSSTCVICDDLLGSQEIVATSHFIADPADPLWRFSDAAMHRLCFLKWELRLPFIEKFNSTAGQVVFGNGEHHRMLTDGTIVSEPVG